MDALDLLRRYRYPLAHDQGATLICAFIDRDGPRTVDQLAESLASPPAAIQAKLTALFTADLVVIAVDGRWGLSPFGDRVLSDLGLRVPTARHLLGALVQEVGPGDDSEVKVSQEHEAFFSAWLEGAFNSDPSWSSAAIWLLRSSRFVNERLEPDHSEPIAQCALLVSLDPRRARSLHWQNTIDSVKLRSLEVGAPYQDVSIRRCVAASDSLLDEIDQGIAEGAEEISPDASRLLYIRVLSAVGSGRADPRLAEVVRNDRDAQWIVASIQEWHRDWVSTSTDYLSLYTCRRLSDDWQSHEAEALARWLSEAVAQQRAETQRIMGTYQFHGSTAVDPNHAVYDVHEVDTEWRLKASTPNQQPSHLLKARSLIADHRLTEALEHYRLAADQSSPHPQPQVLIEMAELQARLGDLESATSNLMAVYSDEDVITKDRSTALRALAEIAAERGETDQAATYLRHAIELRRQQDGR